MRHFYSLLFTLLVFSTALAQWSESFESGIPSTWTIINQGDTNTWIGGQPTDDFGNVIPAQDGTECAKIYFDFSAGHDDYLITPQFQVTVGVNGFISLYAKNASADFTDLFDVLVSTTGTAAADFTDVIATDITPPDAWTNYQFNLNAYAGQNIYVAFRAGSATLNQELDIDLVETFAGPNCPDISDIQVDANTGDTVTLSWTNGSTEDTWDIEYGVTGFTPTGVPTLNDITTNPYTVDNLTSDVTYDFYIRADCGGTDIAQWVGPFTVTTIINYCAGALFTDTGGPNGNYGNNENETWVISPSVAGERVRVTFTDFDVAANDFLKIYDGPDATYPALFTGNGYTGTALPPTVAATDPSGALTFVFTSNGFGNASGWETNIVCEAFPTCPDITQLQANNVTGESAELSWNAGSGQTSWSIEYGPVGFTLGTGTVISGTTDNPYLLEGLSPTTNYDFYVQGECPNNDYSVWAGPVAFATGCATYSTPYTEDFTDMTYAAPPQCWEEADNGDLVSGPLDFGASAWGPDGFANNGYNGAAKVNLWITGKNDWLISPNFDLGDGSEAYEIVVDLATMAYGSDTEQEAFSDDDALYIMMFNNGEWTILETYDSDNTPILLVDHVIPLTGFSGITKFAFYATEGVINDTSDVDVSVDNFRVRVQPTCPQPSGLAVSNITTNSVEVSWNGPSNAVEYIITYVTAGGDPLVNGITVSPNPTSSPYTINNLNHSTPYDVYVTTDCGAADGESFMSGPVSFQTQLPNDDCINAVELTSSPIGESCTTAVAGSITGAQDSGIPACLGTADDDVWYTFVAISNRHRVTLSNLNGTTTDLNFEVFEGTDCDNLTSIYCSDPLVNTIENGNSSDGLMVVGETYYVRVFTASANEQSVTFDICITALEPFAENGSCQTAIIVDANALPYNNSQYNEADPHGGIISGCAGGTNDGYWYEIVGNDSNITIEVTPTNGYNAELAVYSSECDAETPVVAACSSTAGTDGMEAVTFTAEEGTTYYVNVGHYSSVVDFPEGDYDISIYTDTTGVEDIENTLSNHVLYPNPTTGILNYSGNKAVHNVVAYNLEGKLVTGKIQLETNQQIDISTFPQGIYILTLKFEDGSQESFKVIKK